MEVLVILIPVSLTLGGLGLGAFIWAMRSRQFEDMEGDSQRFLADTFDDEDQAGGRSGRQHDLFD